MILSWNTTKRCNLYCKHCYRDSDEHPQENELTLEEGMKLIDGIQATGIFKILILSGGEPLLREDLEDLVSYAKSKGLIPVLGTNGTLLNLERAKSLKASGLAAVGVSLDSVRAVSHDGFRQTPGAFKQAIEGIKNAKAVGLRVQINPTLTRDNVGELEQLVQMSVELGAGAMHPFFLVEAGRGKCITENALSDQEYFDALNEILKLQTQYDIELKPTCAPQFMSLAKQLDMPMRFTRGCLAGISYCCILPDGVVHVCPYLPIVAGDVREKSFDLIWKNSEVFKALREASNYEGNCGNCSDQSICGGCRARAFYKNGHYLAEDPMSRYCFQQDGGKA